MKGQGKHPHNALSNVKVRQTNKAGRYADGNGLYLVVDPPSGAKSAAKRWLLRIIVQGRRRDLGLGGLGLVSLAEAREKAQQYRKIARQGGDPIAEAKKARIKIPTFREAAEAVYGDLAKTWRSKVHTSDWINSLINYAFPTIGDKPLDEVSTPDVLNVLRPIWLSKAVTARRVKQRIGTVMDWAKAAGFRSGENPVDGVAKGLPKQPDRKRHHRALPYAQTPMFISRLCSSNTAEVIRLAFEFLILTGARTGEVLGARWAEIDFTSKVWNIPAGRQKVDHRDHRVPLASRCVEILRRAQELSGGCEFVFPGRFKGKPFSDTIFRDALKRTGFDVTAHGFRSTFRDWAAECTNFPNHVCEMALAHTVKDKTEAAYRRGDLFDKRVALMGEWAAHCQGVAEPEIG